MSYDKEDPLLAILASSIGYLCAVNVEKEKRFGLTTTELESLGDKIIELMRKESAFNISLFSEQEIIVIKNIVSYWLEDIKYDPPAGEFQTITGYSVDNLLDILRLVG